MTDQSKPNLTSTTEGVTEYTLTSNFIQRYKKYVLGMLDGSLFDIPEMQAITATMISDPNGMFIFISNATKVLIESARTEFPIEEDVLGCVTHFNSMMYQVVCYSVVPLLKMTPEQKEAIRQSYLAEEFQHQENAYDAFTGLEFDMNGSKQRPEQKGP